MGMLDDTLYVLEIIVYRPPLDEHALCTGNHMIQMWLQQISQDLP
jgi:hypothetical protein